MGVEGRRVRKKVVKEADVRTDETRQDETRRTGKTEMTMGDWRLWIVLPPKDNELVVDEEK